MPPLNPFRAALSKKAKAKLDVIVEHEEKKAGLDANGQQIRLTPKEIIESLIDTRHEVVSTGVTNRQRMIGLEEAVSKLTELIAILIEKDNVRTADMAEVKQLLKDIAAELKR